MTLVLVIVLIAAIVVGLITWWVDGRFRIGASAFGIVGLLGLVVSFLLTLL